MNSLQISHHVKISQEYHVTSTSAVHYKIKNSELAVIVKEMSGLPRITGIPDLHVQDCCCDRPRGFVGMFKVLRGIFCN